MADNTIPITAGTGTNVRTVTNAAVDGGAHQQIVGLADSAGNLLGTTGAPLPVTQATPIPAGTNSIGSVVNAAGTAAIGQLTPATLVVTATAAAATAVTATLAAAGAGLFHYIAHVRYERFMTAAGTGAGTATLTGGANHGLVFNLPTDAATIGTQSVPVDYRPTVPLRATAANTATTFTAPVVTGTIYRITVTYYTAA